MKTPFINDPFALVWKAFKNLYPDKDCEMWWDSEIRDSESGIPALGMTDFGVDGLVSVFIKPSLSVVDATEVLAHELAHVAVGVEQDHNEVWETAFDAIFREYNRIGGEMFPESVTEQ